MTKYWHEKRILGSSVVLRPAKSLGWLFPPVVLWLLVVVPGFWLSSYAPETWHVGLSLGVSFLALVFTIAVLFLKTNPGPGWWAGWEKERRLLPRFRYVSPIMYFAGLVAGFWFFLAWDRPLLGILFLLCAYQPAASVLLFKDADSAQGDGDPSLSPTRDLTSELR